MEKIQHNKLPRLVCNHKMNGHRITIGCRIIVRDCQYMYEYRIRKDGKSLILMPWEDLPNWMAMGNDWAKLSWSEKFFADTICAHWELKHPLPGDCFVI